MCLGLELYLIEILHQTTTSCRTSATSDCCILSKFYIKPQQRIRHKIGHSVVSYRNSTSNHNSYVLDSNNPSVVSYRNSTSNHNLFGTNVLYNTLYLIEILHQTTTRAPPLPILLCCILSKFYIKPQLIKMAIPSLLVVSYRNSTSNHNSRANG